MTTAISEKQPATSAPWALVSLSLALALSSLSTSITNVSLPTLAQVFAAPFQVVQWIVLANLLAMTTLIVSVGRLGDMFSRRRLLLIGIALFTVASLVCAVVPNLSLMIAARAVQGLGAAILMALGTAFAGDVVPKDKIGSAMGVLGTASAVGTALGPSLGGLLIATFGWRAIFIVMVILGVATFVMSQRTLPQENAAPNKSASRFDIAGTMVLAATLAAYALAMTLGRGHFGVVNIALVLTAFAGVAMFVRVEATAASPLVRLSLFAEPRLRAGFIMSALMMTIAMATMVVGPFYLAGALGLDAVRVGLVLSAGPIAAAVTGMPAGRWVDRFGSSVVMIAGLLVAVVGSGMMATVPAMFGAVGYVVSLVTVTAGYALFQAANNTSVMASASADQRGVISGLLNLSRNLGLITGTSVMGAVFAFASGASDIAAAAPESVARGQAVTFWVACALAVTALVICMRILRRKT